jgi:hypothetical protein
MTTVRVKLQFEVQILERDESAKRDLHGPYINSAIEAALPHLIPGIVEANIAPGAKLDLRWPPVPKRKP